MKKWVAVTHVPQRRLSNKTKHWQTDLNDWVRKHLCCYCRLQYSCLNASFLLSYHFCLDERRVDTRKLYLQNKYNKLQVTLHKVRGHVFWQWRHHRVQQTQPLTGSVTLICWYECVWTYGGSGERKVGWGGGYAVLAHTGLCCFSPARPAATVQARTTFGCGWDRSAGGGGWG